MQIYIDQSGRVEFTSHDTVVAFSNGTQKSILITAQEKRIVQKYFRDAGKPKIFAIKTFAILIFLLIRDDLKHITGIRIDQEYEGMEWLIKQYLLLCIRRNGFSIDKKSISFILVGKSHAVHRHALATFRHDITPGRIATARDILLYTFGS